VLKIILHRLCCIIIGHGRIIFSTGPDDIATTKFSGMWEVLSRAGIHT